MMSGKDLTDVPIWTGIGGSHIEGINSRGVVAITSKGTEQREINDNDLERVIEAARAVVIPMDRKVLQVIPQSYTVDNNKGIRDPHDMLGVRLEAEVHIITCSVTSAQNLIKCVNRAGYRVADPILQSLAAGRAVLRDEDKELGTALIDMGGGTTEVVVYTQGAPFSTFTIPLGGAQVSNDISLVLAIPFETAEEIKKKAGCCWDDLVEEDEAIDIPAQGGRPPMRIPRLQLLQIIRPRMEEILGMVKQKLDKLNLPRPLSGGIVLSGGGAQLAGASELAMNMFRMPVHLGLPLSMGGLVSEYRKPEFAAAVGLVLEGADRQGLSGNEAVEQAAKPRPNQEGNSAPSALSRFKAWIKGEFF
jgi:cell division protein FtsA